MKAHIYKKYPLVILAITIIAIMLITFFKDKIIINTSPSIPLGLYTIHQITAPLKQDDLVVVCLAKSYQDFGMSRGYIHAGIRCKGSAPLLKLIIAVPGDNVVLTNQEIIINNKIFQYSTQKLDSKQRSLPSWPRGNYRNTRGYWLIGTNDQHSWDSRYYGPIDRNQIIFLIKHLWVFGNYDFTHIDTSNHIVNINYRNYIYKI
jgi:conjugative transfer signal peptidase TraF